ncbi:glycoside hydrolase family 15 protein [Aeromicrobium sp. YIM 150415]|uniref:glycoside hydrolase family 15 protein n=1 Tax=Aeromicrobium sp. YIM 150415 TaxID=2803912 RepID=UPI0019638121|nr:glycoside hydrolase family 15 protein [Aeromicrobium sp. YIM 150415]MBM9463733.1 glycoside hydrolase family 15 protein [Aeromicrobium sp. YIM 150415]
MAEEDGGPEFLPIADHGLIGDLRTAALVGTDGTVSWFCPSRFDQPSVFASLLDPEKGGSWVLRPVDGAVRTQQFYFPDTAILATRFLTEEGVVEVHDFMPVTGAHDDDHRQRLVRRVTAVRGKARISTRVAVRPDYAREDPHLEGVDGGVLLTGPRTRLGLSSTAELTIDGPDVCADVMLDSGESVLFVLEALEDGDALEPCGDEDTHALFEKTSRFWRGWLATSRYQGRWRETVHRSAITLKLLTHEPSGAVVAAPTTSLPERVGGGRNWDYRYVWIRDAGFTLYGLLRLGFTDEAGAFVRWLSERLGDEDHADHDLGPLRVLYDIDGDTPVDEHALDHLRGYLDSQPVRVGNAAVDQLQLDIYGEVIDSIYLYNKYGPGISQDAWSDLRRVLDWLLEHWDDEDAGMWEIREEGRKHTTSRLMCWVAVERMIRMARFRSLPGDLEEWSRVRDEIHAAIMENCWNEELQAFVQSEGGSALDAGVLLMPMVKFTSPVDPRFLSTLAAIEERLVADSLVFRYDIDDAPDGLDGEEGTFSLCSFWYVEALTRAGRLEEAEIALEKMFTYANHLGLYAEQVGATGDQLGNFPQAFTHLALISAALNLDRALG